MRLLDAFVYSKFDLGVAWARNCASARQAVSWGESTFIQNGINVINHFDVAALRVPGSELKEGFLPQEMVNFSMQFTDNLSAQAIYLLDWDATVPEPAGSYFSTNDFAPTGGSEGGAGIRLILRPGRGLPPARRPVHHEFPDRESPGRPRYRTTRVSTASTSSTTRPA